MSSLDRAAPGRVRFSPAIAAIPPRLRLFVLVVDVVVLALAGRQFEHVMLDKEQVLILLLFAALAVFFEEGAAHIARLQWRLSAELKRDMTSVWAVAAALALQPWAGVVLLTAITLHLWFRQQRRAGQPLYRAAFAASTVVLGFLAARSVYDAVDDRLVGLPLALNTAIGGLAAVLTYTVVNRALITVALIGVGVRGRTLLGTRDDNLTELATLCLGGLLGLAATTGPVVCILVIPPMIALQRGSFVRELETAATTDAKTGLLNAVAWEQMAQRELARAARELNPVSVLIIDIDRFKLVNDQHGHLVGDLVLRGVGRAVAAAMREYDTVGRFGGEEFVAVLPDADDARALVIAERVRMRVNQLRVSDLSDRPLTTAPDDVVDRLAVSVGVASLGVDGDELSDLLHAADQALYAAKSAGRNRVELAFRGDPGLGLSGVGQPVSTG